MAKKQKNTLNDLNEFLQKSPIKGASGQLPDDYLNADPHTLVEVDKVDKLTSSEAVQEEWTEERIVKELKVLAEKNGEDVRFILYRVIQTLMNEKDDVTSSDLMLANTAIYLEHAEKMAERYRNL